MQPAGWHTLGFRGCSLHQKGRDLMTDAVPRAVAAGTSVNVIVATGMATEIGKVALLIQECGEQVTPLQRRLASKCRS